MTVRVGLHGCLWIGYGCTFVLNQDLRDYGDFQDWGDAGASFSPSPRPVDTGFKAVSTGRGITTSQTNQIPLSLDGDLCKTQMNIDNLLRFSICQVGFSYRFPPTRE